MFMNPYEIAQHERLAAIYARVDKTKAIRERLAVVALNPVDRAEALYQVAVAYRDAGDTGRSAASVTILFTSARCETRTAFGTPVDPDV